MKSLFKRTLAAASSSVLVLSQLAAAAVNVNISAVDVSDSDALVVDRALVLDVPVPAVEPEIATYEGREQPSDWADKAETKLLNAGDKTVARDSAKVRKQIKDVMLKTDWFSGAAADEIVAEISAATATINSDGTAVSTVNVGEIGPIVGQELENVLKSVDLEIKTDDGDAIDIDWSDFSMKGTVTAFAETDFDGKSVTYWVEFTDETGKKYTETEIARDYIYKKLDEAKAIATKAVNDYAAQYGVTVNEFNAQVEDAFDAIKTKAGYVELIAAAINTVKVSAADLETLYTNYDAALDAAIEASGVPAVPARRVVNAIDVRQPQSVDSALSSDRFSYWFERVVNIVNNQYGDTAEVDLTAADVKSVLNDAYDIKASIDGYTMSAEFSIAEDQHDELLAAILASDTVAENVEIPEGMVIDDVISHKVVFVSSTNDAFGMSGEAYFDVIRVIDEIIFKEDITTTTTTTTSTSATTTSTTDESGVGTTTTSTTDDSGVGTTTTSTTDDSGVGTTTTSTTEDSGVGTTTTSTTEDSGVGTTTTSTTEDTGIGTTTTTTETTDPSQTTSTTPGTMISYEVSGLPENGLVYWSEEDCAFDLSDLSVKLHFIVAGEDTGEVVDVTEYYGPTVDNAGDLTLPAGLGMDTEIIEIVLKDKTAVENIITERGYQTDILDNAKTAGHFLVTLVLRGDFDLNGVVNSADAQCALAYYLNITIVHLQAKDVFEMYRRRGVLGYWDDDQIAGSFAYGHYAADAADGNGIISSDDAQTILRYYLEIEIVHSDKTWDDLLKKSVKCDEVLHSNPLVLDDSAKGFEPWT